MPKVFNFKKLGKSIRIAFMGIGRAFIQEQTFRFEFIFAIVAMILAFLFPLRKIERVIIIIVAEAVLSFELLNSQIEKVLDIVSPQRNPNVKRVKDFSAAAVLIISAGAFVVGIIIFLPYFLALFY